MKNYANAHDGHVSMVRLYRKHSSMLADMQFNAFGNVFKKKNQTGKKESVENGNLKDHIEMLTMSNRYIF